MTLLTKALNQPNGIAFSRDETTLYVSASGHITAFIVNADGTLLGTLPLPEDSTNVAFGGPDGTTVFATTFKGVYRLKAIAKLTP